MTKRNRANGYKSHFWNKKRTFGLFWKQNWLAWQKKWIAGQKYFLVCFLHLVQKNFFIFFLIWEGRIDIRSLLSKKTNDGKTKRCWHLIYNSDFWCFYSFSNAVFKTQMYLASPGSCTDVLNWSFLALLFSKDFFFAILRPKCCSVTTSQKKSTVRCVKEK